MTQDQTPSNSGPVSPSELGQAVAALATRYRQAAAAASGPKAAPMADLLRRLAQEAEGLTGGPVLETPSAGHGYRDQGGSGLSDLVNAAAHGAELARAAGMDTVADVLARQQAELEAHVTGA